MFTYLLLGFPLVLFVCFALWLQIYIHKERFFTSKWSIVFMWNIPLLIYIVVISSRLFWCFLRIGSLDLVMVGRCGCEVYNLEARIWKRHQGRHEKNIGLMGSYWSLGVVFRCLLVFTHSKKECFWFRLGFFKFLLHWKIRSKYVLNYWWKWCRT
jgi:hypothetical protein